MIKKLDSAALMRGLDVASMLHEAPPLDPAQMIKERVDLPQALGALEVYRPADARYRNDDPQAPALVMVPGLGADGVSWLRQLPLGALADLYSPQHPPKLAAGEKGLGQFARYIEAFIEARGLHRRPGGVVLLGSSMGGAVSLCTALRGRIPLRGLILAGTFGHRRHLSWFDRNLGRYVARVMPAAIIRAAGRVMVRKTKLFGCFEGDEGSFMVHGINVCSGEYLVKAVAAITTQEQVEAARELKLPTLVTHGTLDWVLPHRCAEELAAAIPGAKLASIEGGGHAFFFTHHREFNAAVARWLVELP
ncbi:MAG: hypothetical protein AMXMBFR7_35710 [Planctomycetota bacterium]